MGTKSDRSWLKSGCLGCLGVVGLGVLVMVALVGVASLQVRSEQTEEQTLVHDATAATTAPTRIRRRFRSSLCRWARLASI